MVKLIPAVVAALAVLLPFSLAEETDRHNDECAHPAVRKEWRTLSAKEKSAYINALKCLTLTPHSSKDIYPVGFSTALQRRTNGTSWYDDLVYLHIDQAHQIHFNSQFLPWHRYFVHLQAKSLREKCNYRGTIPYWDWTQDVQDLSTSPVFSGDSKTGFGGNGNPSQNRRVTDGAFTNVSFSYPYPHTVRRNFNLFPNANDSSTPATVEATPEHVRNVLENSITGNYTDFSLRAARNWPSSHDGIHFYFGGDLFGQCPDEGGCGEFTGTEWTPNEPLFWMHHARVDRIWYEWQKKNPANQWAFGGSLNGVLNPSDTPREATLDFVMSFNGMFPDVTIAQVMKTTNRELCYVYDV